MRPLWYILCFLFGTLGLLGALRSIERIVFGEGISAVQLLIAVVFLYLAYIALRRARSK